MTRLLSTCAWSFSIVFASGRLASAQTTAAFDVPAIVRSGFDSLKAGGFDAAIRVWMKGSPVEQSTTIDRVRGSLQTTSGWVISALLINAQPRAILPPEMLRPATTS
jgi:hypothetical protein